MLALLLFLATPALAADAPAPPAELLASQFVRALVSGRADAWTSLRTAEVPPSPDWVVLRNDLEAYDCISIPSHEVRVERATDTEMTLLVTVHGTAVARGAPRTPLPFPARWRIEAARSPDGWRFRSIVVEERALARCLVAQPDLSPEAIVEAAGDADLEAVLIRLAEELYTAPYSWKVASRKVVRSVAQSHGFTMAELTSLRFDMLAAMDERLHPRAAELAAEARAIAEASGRPDARAAALLASGTTEWQNGRHAIAREHYAAAATLMEEVDDPRTPMKALFMRGTLLVHQGALRDALLASSALEAAAERFDWTEGRCIVMIQRAGLFHELQDPQASKHYAVESLRCAERLGHPQMQVIALSNLAAAEMEVGNVDEAARLTQKILKSSDRASRTAAAVMHGSLADVMIEARRYEEAEAELLIALGIVRDQKETVQEANILQALAGVQLLRGRREEALRTAQEADAIIRQAPPSILVFQSDPSWAVRATLGRALRAAGRLPEATAALQSAVELIEATRAGLGADELTLSAFMRNKAAPYRELVSLFVQTGRPRDAVVIAERVRARALATSLARGRIEPLPAMSDADRQRYDALNGAVSDLNRKLLAAGDDPANAALRERLAELRVEQRALLARVYAASPDLRARNVDDPQTVIGDARRLLPRADEALLTFSVHDEETFAFYLERTGDDLDIAVHRIPMRKAEIEERVRGFVRQVEGRNLDYRRSARALYDLLVAPFAPRIGSKRLLYVVPDGILWRLPFQALQDPGGIYLIESVGIAYAPSLTLLRQERVDRRPGAAPHALLAIADPVLPRPGDVTARSASLAPLREAREEVLAIAKLYGGESRTLIGNEATETAVKRLVAQFPVLHLATHGVIDDASPMYSAVVLGSSETDDGLLEAREMMELDLGADLTILAACESASGDVTPGEGVIGMSWALMVAGCRNTVVSQWKVDSESTAQLMIAFHREISGRDADYASALRQAQLTLLRREKFRHPYYWSPFVLIATSQ